MPPKSVSLPAPPRRVSSPPSPQITSSPSVPVSRCHHRRCLRSCKRARSDVLSGLGSRGRHNRPGRQPPHKRERAEHKSDQGSNPRTSHRLATSLPPEGILPRRSCQRDSGRLRNEFRSTGIATAGLRVGEVARSGGCRPSIRLPRSAPRSPTASLSIRKTHLHPRRSDRETPSAEAGATRPRYLVEVAALVAAPLSAPGLTVGDRACAKPLAGFRQISLRAPRLPSRTRNRTPATCAVSSR